MVKVKVVEPFTGKLPTPNALMITGGATTVMESFDVLPLPPSVEVTCPLLFFTPALVPLTPTEKVQDPLAANVPPAREMVPLPPVAVIVPLPQLPITLGGEATTNPEGSESVNATPVR